MDTTLLLAIIGTFIAIAAYNIARKTFKKDFEEKPNEEKAHLLAQFKATQALSRQTYEVIQKFAAYYNAYDKEVWAGQGITYAMVIEEIRKSHQEGNLSDVLYENLKQTEIPSITIHSHIRSLEQQYEALNLTYQEFRVKTQYLETL